MLKGMCETTGHCELRGAGGGDGITLRAGMDSMVQMASCHMVLKYKKYDMVAVRLPGCSKHFRQT